jgi:hypothetical protein
MQVPLGIHLSGLQQQLEILNEQIIRPGSSLEERNNIESDIRAVNLALDHYRAALEIEQRIAHQT